ncbi:hypothetical protein PMZ80_008406 [Knufia obscura]|uniref:ubiquitinyl hydrolase 1 n=2 Tax=Knufia TaxID=430999 RepID=A0AAN8I650_9EURO|nr:hypothetical protein PMZ80_008406 [Knufia obscura]KAK5951291.1 hypothetical protein OHC33_007709 [Knufia fluminis]
MSSFGTMNRLDFEENDVYRQPEISQRWQAAVTTIILLVIASYGWQHLTYETTIKRRLYEFSASMIPTKFVQLLHTSAARVAGLPQAPASDLGNDTENRPQLRQQTYEGSGVSSVMQSARSLSGFSTKTTETTFAGLGNWDNSCFQNSVLQGLASLQAFKACVEKSRYMSTAAGIDATTHEGLEVFLNQLHEELPGRNTIWPPSILRSMNTWQQQDAQEYFSKIMDAIEKESREYRNTMAKRLAPGLDCLRLDNTKENEKPGNELETTTNPLKSPLLPANPLDGSLSQILRCQRCGFSEGISFMPFNCLTLNLGLGGNCDLENLLDAYTDAELIEGVECDECTRLAKAQISSGTTAIEDVHDESGSNEDSGRNEEATKVPKVLSTKAKRILFGRLPHDLVIHINRSIFDDWGNQRKNTSFVSFPSTLRIVDDWVTSLGEEEGEVHAVYELRCIVTHQGRHDNGHYVACGKRGKQWYSFNDEIVTKITEEQVLNRGHVFMLFYEMVDRRPVVEVTPPGSPSSSEQSSGSPTAKAQHRQSTDTVDGEETVTSSALNDPQTSDVMGQDTPAVYNSEV